MNSDEDGDLFILSCRLLRYKSQELNNDLYYYLLSKIVSKIDIQRKGGSNVNEVELKILFSTIQISEKALRIGHAELWLLKERKIILACMSIDTAVRGVKYSHHSLQRMEDRQ